MLLLDDVLGYDGDSLIAALTITDASLFVTPHGVPGHIGIEYMAQACGAYAGAHALDSGGPVKIGLLLGTRDYRVTVPWFRHGDHLRIAVELAFRDDPVAAFTCHITISDQLVAEAQLKVYQANDYELRLALGGKP
jgi:predicted hotdog family 3-hydroxylacyl-ACP dehydratase